MQSVGEDKNTFEFTKVNPYLYHFFDEGVTEKRISEFREAFGDSILKTVILGGKLINKKVFDANYFANSDSDSSES